MLELNAGIIFSISFSLDNILVLSVLWVSSDVSIIQPYSAFKSSFTINSKYGGRWSTISSTYPSTCPSLYTLIVYVTISPASTLTGFFVWL